MCGYNESVKVMMYSIKSLTINFLNNKMKFLEFQYYEL